MSENVYRKVNVPRLAPRTRVCFYTGRWWHKSGYGYEEQPHKEWGKPRYGVVIPDQYFPGYHFGPEHAWGLRNWCTVIDLDVPCPTFGRVIQYPTSMLEIVEWPQPVVIQNQLLLF